jgi:hypothetical protein
MAAFREKMSTYEFLVQRILSQLQRALEGRRDETHEWNGRLEDLARRIVEDFYFDIPFTRSSALFGERMDRIERQYRILDEKVAESTSAILERLEAGLNRTALACRMRDGDVTGGLTQLILAGGPSIQAVEQGRTEADGFLGRWLTDAEEVTILDPFLFKREKPRHDEVESEEVRHAAEVQYADELLKVLGKEKKVNFIYRGNPDKGDGGPQKVNQVVANRIADRLRSLELKATFFVVDDLHDRVWMKRKKNGDWQAHALGTSRGGIGKRPTYILPMSSGDCDSYMLFVDSLMDRAQKSHERPIDFKRPRAKRDSNSGKVRRIVG